MKKPIRIDLDGPYYPKMTRWQRAWNWAMAALILFAVVCFYF
jgi:hypothetical protein